jgi:hypothetical protein
MMVSDVPPLAQINPDAPCCAQLRGLHGQLSSSKRLAGIGKLRL